MTLSLQVSRTGGVGAPRTAGTVVVRAGPALAAHCADAVIPLAFGRAILALVPRGVVVTAAVRVVLSKAAFPPGWEGRWRARRGAALKAPAGR